MIQSIPITSDLVLIPSGEIFRAGNWKIINLVAKWLETHPVDLIGTTILGGNSPPILIHNTGSEPIFFKEGGLYLKDNPIPHLVTPHRAGLIKNVSIWVYEIYFL